MTIQEMKARKQEPGYTNAQLATVSGVPLGTVMKVLSGATKAPRRNTPFALEKAFSSYQSLPCRYGSGDQQPADSLILHDQSSVYGTSAQNNDSHFTVEDYFALPNDIRTELIDVQPKIPSRHSSGRPTLSYTTILSFSRVQTSTTPSCDTMIPTAPSTS